MGRRHFKRHVRGRWQSLTGNCFPAKILRLQKSRVTRNANTKRRLGCGKFRAARQPGEAHGEDAQRTKKPAPECLEQRVRLLSTPFAKIRTIRAC
jgi:hypothetical protein